MIKREREYEKEREIEKERVRERECEREGREIRALFIENANLISPVFVNRGKIWFSDFGAGNNFFSFSF